MFSAESPGWAPDWLCFLMRLARCRAQLRPAGPAPTIRTSASSCSRATATSFCLMQLFGQGGHDFEDVANHAVVGDFEDRRVLVFVDGDDGARALHAHDVLDGAGNAEGEIEFRRDGLAGAAYLALHGEPSLVADRTGCRDFRAEGFGDGFGLRDVFRRLDATTDGHDERSLGEIDGGFGFFKEVERPGADLFRLQVDADFVDGLCAGVGGNDLIGAKSSGLKGSEPGAGTEKGNISGCFALEHLADEDELAAFRPVTDRVSDHAFAQHGRELWR